MDTVEYAPGRSADVYSGTHRGHVLMWHGRGPNQRAALAPLATRIADRGPAVIVPDWNSEAADGGRAELIRSLRYTRDAIEEHGGDPDSLVLVGWSLGDEPISGDQIPAELPQDGARPPILLFHGVADDLAPVAGARAFVQQLAHQGWPVELVELPTDHWGIVGTTYDAATDTSTAATDERTRRLIDDVAGRIVAVTPLP